MNSATGAALKNIPSVDSLLQFEAVARLESHHPRAFVVRACREILEGLRKEIQTGSTSKVRSPADLALEVVRHVEGRSAFPGRVLNATGIVLHTNLGRARLAPEAVEAMRLAAGACDLELDLETGKRTSRERRLEASFRRIFGVDAAHAVNNNAGALVLCVNELAQGKEVIVSRGELVEIGGSFRLPDVLARAGAILVEVGTTNRTTVDDYARAINPRTAALLRVHRSNFRQDGFVHEPPIAELAGLARDRGTPLIHDLGSGSWIPLTATRFEPSLSESLDAKVDLLTLSGDKLLGGPQAGIVLGRTDLVERTRRNPLSRALRLDKCTIAALAATLDLLEDAGWARSRIPTLRQLAVTPSELSARATRMAEALSGVSSLRVRIAIASSEVGGGAAPGEAMETSCVALKHETLSAEDLAREFRRTPVPLVGRIVQSEVFLDPRTLEAHEDDECVRMLVERFGRPGG